MNISRHGASASPSVIVIALPSFTVNALITPGQRWFMLNSTGGDIDAAMEIGRLLRKTRAKCFVLPESKCYSACVLVLAGGVDRQIYGDVGIHRPYSSKVGSREYSEVQREHDRYSRSVSAFLSEMNIPAQLFEAMIVVPSEEVRILPPDELAKVGLAGMDPVEAETQNAFAAQMYGLTKAEYLHRKGAVDSACPLPANVKNASAREDYANCRIAYFYGLPVKTYLNRAERAQGACSGLDMKSAKGQLCYLQVMRGER